MCFHTKYFEGNAKRRLAAVEKKKIFRAKSLTEKIFQAIVSLLEKKCVIREFEYLF